MGFKSFATSLGGGIIDRYTDGGVGIDKLDFSNIGKDLAMAGTLYGIMNPNDSSGINDLFGNNGPERVTGYTGGTPNYTATRGLVDNAFSSTYPGTAQDSAGIMQPATLARRPGMAGRKYFTDTKFEKDVDEPIIGTTKEQIAAKNQAALDDQALFESILGGVEKKNVAARADLFARNTSASAAQVKANQDAAAKAATDATDAATALAAQEVINDQAATDATFFNQYKNATLGETEALALIASGYSADVMAAGLDVSVADLNAFLDLYRNPRFNTDIPGPTGTAGPTVTPAGPTVTPAGPTVTPAGPTVTPTVTPAGPTVTPAASSLFPDIKKDGVYTLTELDTVINSIGGGEDQNTLEAISTDFGVTTEEAQQVIDSFTANPFASIPADDDYTLADVGSAAQLIANNSALVPQAANHFGISETEVNAVVDSYIANPFASINNDDVNYTQDEIGSAAQLISQNPSLVDQAAEYFNFTAEQVRGFVKYYEDNPTEFVQGGIVGEQGYNQGGTIGEQGYYLGGTTDGMADQVPATINNAQPAALSDGEFVIPADVVSHLGNGNSDAGANNLYSMMDRIRLDRTGNPDQGRQIDPNKYLA